MSLTKNKMRAARDLIKQKRYAEARKILVTIDHPVAKDWISTIDQIAPSKRRRARPNRPADLVPEPDPDLDWLDRTGVGQPPSDIQRGKRSHASRSQNTESGVVALAIVIAILIAGLGVILAIVVSRTVEEVSAPTLNRTSDILGTGAVIQDYSVTINRLRSNTDPSDLAGEFCSGWVGSEPNHIVEWPYRGGRFRVRAVSDVDTVLLIQAPNGQWFCDDDSGGDYNPQLTFNTAPAGEYRVYVGPWLAADTNGSATLHITLRE